MGHLRVTIGHLRVTIGVLRVTIVAGGDPSTMLEFFHGHLDLGALGYIKTFSFYWSWVFFSKKTPPRPKYFFR